MITKQIFNLLYFFIISFTFVSYTHKYVPAFSIPMKAKAMVKLPVIDEDYIEIDFSL